MKKHISIVLYTIISVFVITGLVFAIFLILNEGPDMTFPRKMHGEFIEKPQITEVDGKKFVEWTVSRYCQRNGYEVQSVDYKADTNSFWGGRDDAKCVPGNGGYQCRGEILDEMKQQGSEWMVQASSYECSGNVFFVSDAVKNRIQ